MDPDDIIGHPRPRSFSSSDFLNLIGRDEEFAGCVTTFEFLRRVLQLDGDVGIRKYLACDMLCFDGNFDTEPVVETLVDAIRRDDEETFVRENWRARRAAMKSGKWKR